MSDHCIQFKLAYQSQKINGKIYKSGDIFPYDPANRNHFLMYEQGIISAEKVAEKAPEKAAETTTSGKKYATSTSKK